MKKNDNITWHYTRHGRSVTCQKGDRRVTARAQGKPIITGFPVVPAGKFRGWGSGAYPLS